MAKNHWILPKHSNVNSKVGLTLAGPPRIMGRGLPQNKDTSPATLLETRNLPFSIFVAIVAHNWQYYQLVYTK